ncbi:MAG: hypothetical protein ACTSPY_01350 [Candidatus Helarchaeota archaeon]
MASKDRLFIILVKIVLMFFIIPIIMGAISLSKPLNRRITQTMEKYGREDVVKTLLMSGFFGLINLLINK